MLKGGLKNFWGNTKLVFTRYLDVLAILKGGGGGCKKFPLFERGGGGRKTF